MTFLVGEIAAYLAVATLLGVAVGWFLNRCSCRKSIDELNTKIDEQKSTYTSELETKEQQLLSFHHDIVNLTSELALAQGTANLMQSRWQSTLKQARQAPNQLRWIQALQTKLADKNLRLSQNRQYAEVMAAESRSAKENLQRVHTRLSETSKEISGLKSWVRVFQTKLLNNKKKNKELGDWVMVFQNKLRKTKTEYGQLRNFATAIDKSNRANRENLQRVHSRLTEVDNKQQPLRTWISVFQNKLKHTRTNYGQLRSYATNIQAELNAKNENLGRTHTRLTNVARELEHVRKYGNTAMPAIPAETDVKDNKVLRIVDRIRLLGTSKNEVYGRMSNQLREAQLGAVQTERILTDSCEEKDAIIYDLRQQLRKAENRAQQAPIPILDQSVKIKELEAKLARANSESSAATALETQIREHQITIDAYRSKLADAKNQLLTERVQKQAKPAVEKPASAKKSSKSASNSRPRLVKNNRSQSRDDLKLIKGVGPKIEAMLNKLGINTFAQIAQWNNSDIEQMSSKLGSFKDRITRDDWIKKARELHEKKYG